MKIPEIPLDEQKRISTLRSLNILDTPCEERFDRLTRMARRVFNVPIAYVSLVDENRQWLKSCSGMNMSETPRNISFCGHAILGNDIFIIPDATQDERFFDNPLVLNDPKIRFYAGCPLSALNGSKLGTLCIVDQQPRHFSEEDMHTLRDLAAMVERELAAVQMATQDELTHLTNRRGFMMLSQHALNLSVREEIPVSLVFMDLNKFKPINDKFGHAEGDRALLTFANHIKEVFRDSDIYARLGGDEFVVLLLNTTKEKAEHIIANCKETLEVLNLELNRGYDISFSYGIVEFQQDKHESIDDLLTAGDELMYQCKAVR